MRQSSCLTGSTPDYAHTVFESAFSNIASRCNLLITSPAPTRSTGEWVASQCVDRYFLYISWKKTLCKLLAGNVSNYR